ncbi:amino acid ABC transporter permease [Legionella oakridgensis]|uniref:Amine acid ABC transporter, permease protein, 3-TM region, His/Glu/Gln/Arg/opine family n=2 Tax=Legionella oakridgensis TaxID=29423 RepID=W0BAW7_9GAMM|nr:amino acid ABC transporter permease [Legionella oakridgensis]AHE67000.1 amine acid ABC transporter, permease protein, 3-TM region, His/Glu/Gln/Arg/opine family [Legionella oakridgensis ATCC 33761 = DSM 21215]KTD38348.1 amino acid (glutamine) ABC transporter permease [Legionella oakridgensis]STY20099.1 amino acid (glutamine) ABC transporter permease [Legionella longbeachae]
MDELNQSLLFIGKGIGLTLQLLTGSITIGLILGILWAICRYQGLAVPLINRFISIMRGTPLILQLSLVYFSTPAILGVKPSILVAGIITYGLNSSAYLAEILRAGIESLPKGQFEAAKTLHIPTFYVWKDIILPQVLKNIFPALVNELISLLKETALISTIGGMDLMRHAQALAAEQFTYFLPLTIAGAYYYGLVLLIETAGKRIEKRGQYVANY